MSRKRRSFLGRDDVIGVPEKSIDAALPEPYQPPEPKPQSRRNPEGF